MLPCVVVLTSCCVYISALWYFVHLPFIRNKDTVTGFKFSMPIFHLCHDWIFDKVHTENNGKTLYSDMDLIFFMYTVMFK